MNKKAQTTIMMSVIIGAFLFIAGMLCLNFIKMLVSGSPDGEGNLFTKLNCDATDISDGTMATCLIGELIVPIAIVSVFSVAGGIILARLLV